MKKIISILLAAYSVGMMASVLEQTISLNEGWNAVYLEVTPEESKTADVFENTSVIRIGCYSQYSYSSTIQYTKDGTKNTINQKVGTLKLSNKVCYNTTY